MKQNRSAKSLLDERNYDSASSSKPNFSTITAGDTNKYSKYTNASSTVTRNTSNNAFDRDEKTEYDPKIPSINGNIIHVTVNNYMAPVNPMASSLTSQKTEQKASNFE